MTDATADAAGFCGAELLPHAMDPDGLPVPAVCTLEPHPPGTWHANGECSWHPDLGRIA